MLTEASVIPANKKKPTHNALKKEKRSTRLNLTTCLCNIDPTEYNGHFKKITHVVQTLSNTGMSQKCLPVTCLCRTASPLITSWRWLKEFCEESFKNAGTQQTNLPSSKKTFSLAHQQEKGKISKEALLLDLYCVESKKCYKYLNGRCSLLPPGEE